MACAQAMAVLVPSVLSAKSLTFVAEPETPDPLMAPAPRADQMPPAKSAT